MGLGCGGEKVSREEEVKRAIVCEVEMWRRCGQEGQELRRRET
jgi:hypothetical protein